MEQRPLRLGDIVDDYCPRERRITNHAIVAIVGQEIRQTRCATCEAEHVYKDGKVPRRTALRRKDGEPIGQLAPPRAAGTEAPPPEASPVTPADGSPDLNGQNEASAGLSASAADADGDAAASQEGDDRVADGWLAHRPLIRATLPRTDGDPPTPRPIPEFTMHQRQARGGGRAFRQAQGWHGNGHQPNGFRHGRPGNDNVNGNNDRQGQSRHGHGGGRPGRHRGPSKRSR